MEREINRKKQEGEKKIKLNVFISYTYGESSGFLYICLYFKHQFTYCDTSFYIRNVYIGKRLSQVIQRTDTLNKDFGTINIDF